MAETDPMIGRVLHGTIEIRRRIGAGGMGNVYEGYQEHLDRRVAVKVMTPQHAANPVAAKYFLREARSASKLRHPNIIQIIDFGKEDDDTIFIAMEYIPGAPLTKLIRQKEPLAPDRIINILDQTLAALVEAHRKQIVHRDLKPDNLMIEEMDGRDFVKVLDFGIAQSKAPERKAGPLTQQGAVVGTPQYMSPEQASGDSVDGRSDLFSLGIILYEMLTKEPPFTGQNMPEILISVLKHHPQPPSALRPDLAIDPTLEAICLRALKKEPDLRYQDADEFREALKRVGEEAPPKPAAAPAQFIFKRAGKKARSKSDEPSDAGEAAEQPRSPAEPSEPQDGAVPSVATQDTVATPAGPLKPGTLDVYGLSEASVSGESATMVTEGAGPKKPTDNALGLDIGELRGDLLGERAIVTALVVHQRSHRRIDPEDMAELRGQIDAVFNEVCQEWGARLHSRQGSFVTLLFGVPTPRPDDSFRATQAALALRRKLGQFTPEGTVFGYALASGEVYAPSGNMSQIAGAPLDDATEAARVAGDDNVVAAGVPLQTRLETMFRLGVLDEENHRPILGVLDVGRAKSAEQIRSGVELIGRDTEIATLLSAYGRLSKGRGSALAIVGEPGVGKSAILEEALRFAEQRGARSMTARWRGEGAEAVRNVRLQWLLDVLRHQGYLPTDAELAFREAGLQREYARLLAAFVHDRMEEAFGFVGRHARSADADARAERALQVAMQRLARAMSEEVPLVVFLDDVTTYSGAVTDLVERWTETAGELPVLFFVAVGLRSSIPAETLPEKAEVMHLMPLEEPAALAFLKVRLPSTLPTNLIARLARVGSGFPLHLEHLARYAKSRDDLSVEAAEQWLAKSRDIAELLRMRLFEQPKPAQNVLALMATLGDGIRGEALLDLASAEWEPESVLNDLQAEGLIEVAGDDKEPRLFFRPPALRHVVYDRLSKKMRARVHERAVAYFEDRVRAHRDFPDREDLLDLARHQEASGEWKRALKVYQGLATKSFRAFDYDSGRQHLQHAIGLLEKHAADATDARAELELQLVRADEATGDHGDALDRARKLDRTDGLQPRLAIEVRLTLAELWLVDEDPDLVGRLVREETKKLRQLLESEGDDEELRCLLVIALQLSARVHELQNRLAQAAEHSIEAAELTERGSIDPLANPWGPRLIWETLNQLGRIRIRLGELGGARKMFDLAMRVVTESDDRRGEVAVRGNIATLQTAEGDLEGAYQNIISALRIARRLSDPFALARLEYNRGLVLVRQKRLEMAIEAHESSLDLAEQLDWREGIAMNADRLQHLRETTEDDLGDRFLKPKKR